MNFQTNRPPKEAYASAEWMERERTTLFAHAWTFVGVTNDFMKAGDYRTVRSGSASVMALMGKDGELHAFHNICRHRGAELLDNESGNTGGSLVCPYHRWTYGLDGNLRGLPNKAECFPDLDRAAFGLKPARIGRFNDLVFVNPDPEADFDGWIAPLAGKAWPHDLFASDVKEAVPLVYDLKCDWKVFIENAIDGYHLAYLHENTLGGPLPGQNLWERAGDHLIWYATEDGIRLSVIRVFETDGGLS
ncbi:MAG: Rieske 2Fe-2S domain-containing protein [Rhizobiaceae bacterium]|nr:Rieske 2Fe-2S domain-containing protein [Rhizobiaceae bacterium]